MPERNDEPMGVGINGVIPGSGRCVIQGCGLTTPRDALMCRPHWRSVPDGLEDNLQFVMARWRRDDATLEELRTAQWACVEAVTADV